MEEEYLRKQQQQDEKYLETFQEGPAFISQPAGDMLKINEIDNKDVTTNSIPADPRCRFQWALMPIILWMKVSHHITITTNLIVFAHFSLFLSYGGCAWIQTNLLVVLVVPSFSLSAFSD